MGSWRGCAIRRFSIHWAIDDQMGHRGEAPQGHRKGTARAPSPYLVTSLRSKPASAPALLPTVPGTGKLSAEHRWRDGIVASTGCEYGGFVFDREPMGRGV